MHTLKSTPKADGFRMPGEFEEREADFLIWPERTDTWRDGGKPAQKILVDVATELVKHEKVTVFCSAGQYENARARLPEEVRVVEMTIDDAWTQDKGPFYVINDKGDIRGVSFGWNAYGGLEGGLYFPWNRDAEFSTKLLDLENIDRYDARHMVLEGGATQFDGEGTLIITENSVLNHNRNPHMTKEEVEQTLKDYLNLEKVIWLRDGMAFDETDGHIDDVCFFVKPGVLALSWTDDPENPQYANLKEAYDILSNETDAKGRKFEIHKIPIPGVIHISEEENAGIDICESAASREAGLPLAVTYINSYLANGAILVPQFGDPMDEVALKLFAEIMPDREVVPVNTRDWSLSGGNIHCMTLQKPKA
ncbi:MAG: agmatine deiminase [Lachnospiraceae bacterium]|nr:agmatine deiminase [Lachnospiraceae bacterium]